MSNLAIPIVRSYSHAGILGETLDNESVDAGSSGGSNNLNLFSRSYGEFSVTLCKVNGSLGFTLSSGGCESRLRHAVKALVKEPAISDGQIKPGDKLITANGVECDGLDHQELIKFLRSCPPTVNLRLYR